MLKKERPPAPDAQDIAIAALAFIAGDEERLSRFIALTGLTPGNMRAAAAQPGFWAAVLDHVVADEELLLAVAADQRIGAQEVALAQARLSPVPHWS